MLRKPFPPDTALTTCLQGRGLSVSTGQHRPTSCLWQADKKEQYID